MPIFTKEWPKATTSSPFHAMFATALEIFLLFWGLIFTADKNKLNLTGKRLTYVWWTYAYVILPIV